MLFNHAKRLKRTVRALTLVMVAIGSPQAHAIPHRTSLYHTLGSTHTRSINAANPLPSLYWQSAFDTQTSAVVMIPTSTPRPMSAMSVPMPEPGTFYAPDSQGNMTLFDLGLQSADDWEPVAPPKALPTVRPGFATLALATQTGPNGTTLAFQLPAGPKVKPKNWRHQMVLNARKFLGIPYKWGGNTPDEGMDCSAFARWVAAMTLGKALPRLANQQSKVGVEVPKDQLQPGDLVFFDTERGEATHVGIYVGGNVFINAPHTGAKIRFENLTSDYWEARWHGARSIG